mmetsp:Transcript_235/g.283  ORF Transcript_235/g.283 Transcript_235/m.283 type:complete len:130 (+) Transcript_235:8-397(+)|eukprot:CAMPEP_0114351698 /NCGR_PEP_ID=MMETSP0101-20121206/17401_1 /TAXON_ID=38822 ORGANISM="Pteridomonas danica, Strain PT" /NCGR_SAMPLE_ID=MMETSP0101 /ASSEMBLY_ACC=CAM_ASM_000211 /LENGTH=129 /DNA_ID=CAMNT_0001491749 /DNA_START=15 /DNA_END=404 /DNA_ORIENTATION=+
MSVATRPADDLPDVEVRFEDQQQINEFGRLNHRLHEIQDDMKVSKEKLETLEDATTELMMGGDSVRLKIGEAFFDCSEEYATEYCEKKQEKLAAVVERMNTEEATILARQKELKVILYGRFGKAINLEE